MLLWRFPDGQAKNIEMVDGLPNKGTSTMGLIQGLQFFGGQREQSVKNANDAVRCSQVLGLVPFPKEGESCIAGKRTPPSF
jgi:hypothetical protein